MPLIIDIPDAAFLRREGEVPGEKNNCRLRKQEAGGLWATGLLPQLIRRADWETGIEEAWGESK